MLKTTNKCSFKFLILIVVFCCNALIAQNADKISLLNLFATLEEKHDIRFSFASDEVADILIEAPPKNSTLFEVLAYLNSQTPLLFTQIDSRYITVVLKSQEKFLCGILVDESTLLPLEGATILGNEIIFATSSDAEGKFYLPEKYGLETINISYVGFQSIQLNVSELTNNCSTVVLSPLLQELSEVLLSTLFTKGIRKQLDGAFSINTENFGLLPGQVEDDVLQIAQALPGVESVDETISNINIRGGTHDENNILWDDIKMYQSGHFFGLISAFNPDLTKKVTVYKNGTNPRYGEGVSGVIDMRSFDDISETTSGGIGFNLINTHAFGRIPVSETLGVQVSGRRSINDFLQSPVYGIYEDRIFQDSEITAVQTNTAGAAVTSENNFSFYDLSAKLLWNISDKGTIRVNFLTVDNSLDFTETLDTSASSETSKLDQSTTVGGISWGWQWNEKVKSSVLGYGSYYLLKSVNEEIFTTQRLLQENEVLETGAKLDVSIQHSEKINVDAGYHFSETGIANTQDVNLPRFRSFEKDVLRIHSVFGNLLYKSNNNRTHTNIGFRANYLPKFDMVLIEPRLSLHQDLGSGFAFELLGEFKSQTTTQRIDFDSDFLGVEKRRWVLATNDEVPVITSKQASAGLEYQKNNWFINLEGFYKFVDGITATNQGFQNQFQFKRSKGSYSAKGLEFVLNKKTRFFSTWITYLLMQNDYSFESFLPSEFSSNLDIRHTATLASAFTKNNLKLALGIDWHSGKPYTSPVSGEEVVIEDGLETINYNLPNEERLSSYFRTNLSAQYLWEISSRFDAKFNFAVLNVLNTKNTLNIRYALDKDENGDTRVNQIEEVSLGITPNFSFQFLF
jgi:hypothetical protein